MDTLVCPKGHQSSDQDYCSECGAKIGNGAASGAAKNGAASEAEACPDCGTAREHKGVVFCEICGYNFLTGARGEMPVSSSTPVVAVPEQAPVSVVDSTPESPSTRAVIETWTAVVSVDGSAKEPDSPDAPTGVAAFEVVLNKAVNLIGRTSQTRAIFPEIAIDYDDAVSHRHALLQFDADGGLVVRDIGAANGTRVNGTELEAMVDRPLKDGDAITLGHWSRIMIRAAV
jgi:uncharacterized Zn finger protein (UPF0148 family)